MAQQSSRSSQASIQKVDPVWAKIRSEAEDVARLEPQIGTFIYSSILHHDTLEAAVVYRVSERLDHADVQAGLIRQAYADALEDQPQLGDAFRADIVAVFDRDPATDRFLEPVLYYKGFHAIQTHRLAHWLWTQGRKDFAYYLQSRASGVFQCDIHPAAKVGRGIFLDHATGLVVGETAVIGDNVSMLHGVTLGRHRQGPWRPASEDRRRRADRRRRQHHRQHHGRPLRARRRGIGGAEGCAEQRHRGGRAGQGGGRCAVRGALPHHGPYVPWIIAGPFAIPQHLLSQADAEAQRGPGGLD